MITETDIAKLTPAECAALAIRLWERAYKHPEAIKITPEQMTELNRRMDAIESGEMPPGKPWNEVLRGLEEL